MKKNNGFTLIELIAVIVILGILCATALPKFQDISRDSKIANLQALDGAVKSAVSLVGAKSIATTYGGACLVYNKNKNGAFKGNSACPGIETTFPVETGFSIPIAKVAGIIYSLDGDQQNKISSSGNFYDASSSYAEFFKTTAPNNAIYQCSDLNARYCYLWINDATEPKIGASTSNTWGTIYIGIPSSFVKKNGTRSIDENSSCILKYQMRWIMTNGIATSAEYKTTILNKGC